MNWALIRLGWVMSRDKKDTCSACGKPIFGLTILTHPKCGAVCSEECAASLTPTDQDTNAQ